MTPQRPHIHRRSPLLVTAAIALTVAFAVLAGACGSSKSKGGGSTTVPPEKIQLPIEQVRTLLPTVVAHGNNAAAAASSGDFAAATKEADEIEETWEKVEGTVKARDANAYVGIEDAQARIRSGAKDHKADQVHEGAADQASLVDTFLAKHGS